MKKNFLVLLGVIICIKPLSGYANNIEHLSAKLAQCGTFSQDHKRLACFDALLGTPSLKGSAIVKEDKVEVFAAPIDKKQAQLVEKQRIDDFAKEHLKRSNEERTPAVISSSVTKLKKLLRGQWIITLANEQKWQQKDSKKLKLKTGDVIHLKKGMMGAVYLFKDGSNRSIAVKRIK
ncbi:MAG: hypothetical protein QF552_09490 [Litorilituus sp.]|nr:hypothetical protein [Litorilituus sp.]